MRRKKKKIDLKIERKINNLPFYPNKGLSTFVLHQLPTIQNAGS